MREKQGHPEATVRTLERELGRLSKRVNSICSLLKGVAIFFIIVVVADCCFEFIKWSDQVHRERQRIENMSPGLEKSKAMLNAGYTPEEAKRSDSRWH